MNCGIISDIFLSTELIPKKRLKKWIQRPGFNLRKVVILKWIVLGNILTLGYKTTLLSSLIPIRYEDTIESLDDLDKSELPLILPQGTALYDHLANDPREMLTRIMKRRITIIKGGAIPLWAFEMYVKLLTQSCTKRLFTGCVNIRQKIGLSCL